MRRTDYTRRVLMLINTSGIDYDDRLRKESETLAAGGHEVEIFAFEYKNTNRAGMLGERIRFRTAQLFSRRWFGRGKALPVKMLEAQLRMLSKVIRSGADVIWIHNFATAPLIPALRVLRSFGRVRSVIWDLHELPPCWIVDNKVLNRWFGLLVRACDVVLVANPQRKAFMVSQISGVEEARVMSLRNYADRSFVERERCDLPVDLEDWLGESEYILAQGGANPGRHLDELVEAIMKLSDMRLVVVGPYNDRVIDRLERRWSSSFSQRIWFTGLVPQQHLSRFIDRSIASVVFYSSGTPNSWLCEPNRLYQAIGRGIPVVVGDNPPMKEFVEATGAGVVIEGDGADPNKIYRGLVDLRGNYYHYRSRAQQSRNAVVWDEQASIIATALG